MASTAINYNVMYNQYVPLSDGRKDTIYIVKWTDNGKEQLKLFNAEFKAIKFAKELNTTYTIFVQEVY